jgi:hypothetical protein
MITIEPTGSGDVRVTVTEESGPVTVTVTTLVSWREFCRAAWPIVQSYQVSQRDGITDVLPAAD